MKYFSLSYNLTKKDYDNYYRDFGKGLILGQLKRSVITLIFMVILVFMYFSVQTASLIATVVFIGLVTVTAPLLYSKKLTVLMLNARNNRKTNRYDFFDNHIEIHIDADEVSGSSIERHLKMNGFVSVIESKTSFYFSYMSERVLIIPKRVIDEEKYGMIKNLIDNYFSNIYRTIQ